MFQLLDGKTLSIQIKEEIATEVRHLMAEGHRTPHLAAVIVGNDGARPMWPTRRNPATR